MSWGCFCCQAIKMVQCLCWIFKSACQPDTWNVNNIWCCFPVGIWHKAIPGSYLLAVTYFWHNIMVFTSSLARDLRTGQGFKDHPWVCFLSVFSSRSRLRSWIGCNFAVLKPNIWPVLSQTWQKKQWKARCSICVLLHMIWFLLFSCHKCSCSQSMNRRVNVRNRNNHQYHGVAWTTSLPSYLPACLHRHVKAVCVCQPLSVQAGWVYFT